MDDGEEVGRVLPGGRLEQQLEGFHGSSGLLEVGSRGGRDGHRFVGR